MKFKSFFAAILLVFSFSAHSMPVCYYDTSNTDYVYNTPHEHTINYLSACDNHSETNNFIQNDTEQEPVTTKSNYQISILDAFGVLLEGSIYWAMTLAMFGVI